MKSIRKLYRVFLVSLILICSGVLVASAVDQNVVVTNTNSNAVYVRTGNNVLSINNITWDQRLSTIQTASQSTKTNLDTLLNRFGFTGTYRLDDALSMIYTENQGINSKLDTVVSNGAIFVSDSSSSDIYALLSHEFPYGYPTSGDSIKRHLNMTEGFVHTLTVNSNADRPIIAHIDSDIHSMGSSLGAISSDVDSIQALTNSNLPAIKVNLDNIAVDTYNIGSDVNIYFRSFNSWLRQISLYNDAMQSDIDTLRLFFADSDTLAHKADSEISSNSALDSFTGSGSGAASAQDYGSINTFSDDLKSSFTSNIPTENMTDILSDGYNWGWFSQATFDSINPQSNTRKAVSNDYSVDSYLALYEQLEKEGVPDPLQNFYKDLGEALND